MKRVSLLLYLGILLASLALAYLTWVEKPKKPGEKVTVLPCKKGDILRLAYEAKDRTVTFSKKKSRYSGESAWWVEIARSPEAPDAGASPARVEVFKANDRMQDEIDKFCPWKALRSLGKLEQGKQEEFGLTESVESLTIEQATGPRTFRLGAATFGPKDRYVVDDETSEAFLVAGQGLRDLLRPKSRFMERSLHAFKTKEIARVRLRAGQREKELVQQISEEGKEQGWADSRSPEEAKDLYRNWIRKLSTLRPTDYVGMPVDAEGGGCVAPAGSSVELSLAFFSPTKEIGFLTLYKGEGTDEKGDATYYACSEHSEIVVKVPKTQAETLLKDLEDVLDE
jgi:hypothetical protein